jgi:hypothetical protein
MMTGMWLLACTSTVDVLPPEGTAGQAQAFDCSPATSRPCDLDAQGNAVSWPRLDDRGAPLGSCRQGLQRCTEAGQWGPCEGLVPPSVERCDGLDNDCDGLFDNDAVDAPLWRSDHDRDGFLDATSPPIRRCDNPGKSLFHCLGKKDPCPGSWSLDLALPGGDCDDLDGTIHPGAWDGPALPRLPSGLAPPGLQAQFFAVTNDVIPDLSVLPPLPEKTRTDIALDYRLARGALAPDLPFDLAARWTGRLSIRAAGIYTFYTISDDGVRIRVNDQLLIDDWNIHGETENSAAIQLPEGDDIPIEVEWFDSQLEGTISLQWAPPGAARQTLTTVLEPPADRLLSRCDAVDEDCDGTADNGVFFDSSTGLRLSCNDECDPLSLDPSLFMTRRCNEPVALAGACQAGVQVCLPGGVWSDCAGDVQARPRDCTSTMDLNCDGLADDQIEGGCSCDPAGLIEEFEAHPDQDGVGECRAGVRECVEKGGQQVWQVLVEPVGPRVERCQVQRDYDCNGVVGDAACRALLLTSAPNFSQQGCSPLPQEAYPSLSVPQNHGHWAGLAVWVNPEDTTGMAPVFRCICPSLGYATTSIDLACSSPPIGCTGPEDTSELVGYVSRENTGGYSPVNRVELSSGATGYCNGDESGCIFGAVCIGLNLTGYWTL